MKDIIQKVKKIFVSPSLASLWRWSAGQRKSLLALSIGEMLLAFWGLMFTVVTKEVIDAAVAGSMGQLKLYAWMLAGVILLQLGTSLLLRYQNLRVTSLFRQQMRSMIVGKTLGKQYSELADVHSGELTGKLLTDTSTVTSAIVQIVPQLLFLMTQFIGAAILLFRFNPVFVFSLIGICLLGAVFMAFVGNRMKRYHKEAREREDKVLATVQESMQNLRIIKASEIEADTKNRIWNAQDAYVKAELRRGKFSSAANTGVGFIFRFTWLYSMLWGCFAIYNGTMSYGMLTAMLQLVGQVQGPISNLSGLVAQLYGAVSSAERLDELLAKRDEEQFSDSQDAERSDGKKLYQGLQEIAVENLHFSYGREAVLKGLDLSVHPGDITAITGHSGCGKSTFFLLLMGLYEPQEGKIAFRFRDGETGDYELSAGRITRRMFSYVPQGNALFSGTIRENVTMFRKEASEEEIRRALEQACILEFVDGLEAGLETMLGEKGLGLSEGQAQRIAIARAFLSDAPILLFDEATSALDEATEAQLLEHIAGLKDKTCLVVTHRPAALEICTKHVSLE